MDYFQIAGITVGIEWENEGGKRRCYCYHDCIILPRVLEAFHIEAPPDRPDMHVLVQSLNRHTGPLTGKRIINQLYYQTDNHKVLTEFDPYNRAAPGYSILMSGDYSTAEYTPHIKEYEHYDLHWMTQPFECRALYMGGLVLHGAALEYSGKGFIFTGSSGAGKTTQAHLWQRYRDALIINGDCPAIMPANGKPRVYGTPWCGSSGETVNRSIPLDSVFLIKHGDTNTLKELTGHEAFLALLANVFHSNFDSSTLDRAIENIKRIIQDIRVFELTCTIDESSVETVEKVLF